MPAALKVKSTLAAPITLAAFAAQLDASLQASNVNATKYVPYDQTTDPYGNLLYVYQVVFDASKVYGTIYFGVNISKDYYGNIQATCAIYTAWDNTAHSGQKPSQASQGVGFAPSGNITFLSYSTDEYNFLFLQQLTSISVLGWLRPAVRRSWIDENQYPWCFCCYGVDFSYFTSCQLSPYGGAINLYTSLNNAYMSLPNPANDNMRDDITGILLFSNTNQGSPGQTSSDLTMCCATGMSRFDPATVPGANIGYDILNPVAGGLGVRTV